MPVLTIKTRARKQAFTVGDIRLMQCCRQRSWSQLARCRAAKHRAVGMTTEEHFPPDAALLHRRSGLHLEAICRYFVIIYTRSRSAFTAEPSSDEKAGYGVRTAASFLPFVVKAVWTVTELWRLQGSASLDEPPPSLSVPCLL